MSAPSMTIDDVVALLRNATAPDDGILLDDGEFYIEAKAAESGLLLRICDVALLEEDDAECCGGFRRREDGIWLVNCRVKFDAKDTLDDVSWEFDDRHHAIASLWLLRHSTAGYQTGRTWDPPRA